jgi:hypothetical protein
VGGMIFFSVVGWPVVIIISIQLLFNKGLRKELKKKNEFKNFNVTEFYKNLTEFKKTFK